MRTIEKIRLALTGAVNRLITAKLAETVSVMDFGAVGDAITDDYPAFVAAHNALPNGGIIYVPQGNYLLKSNFIISNPGISLVGTGSSTTSNEAGGTRIWKWAGSTSACITITGGSCKIANMIVKGDTGNTGDGIVILGGRAVLEDVSVYTMGGDGVRIGSTTSSINANLWNIRNLKSKNNGGSGLNLNDKVSPTGADANGGTLLHADLQSNGDAGCVITNAQLNTFVGLVCQNNLGRGLSCGVGCDSNSFFGGDFEANGADEISIEAGSTSNRFIGGNVAGSMTDNGNNTIILGMSGTQFVTGIKLGNFGSTDSKVLDWYEEDVWTPVLTFQTPGNLAVSYSSQVGQFTRIGNRVHATFVIATSSFTYTTATGECRITGLPYAAGGATGMLYTGTLEFQGITAATTPVIVPRVDRSQQYIKLFGSGSGAALTNMSTTNVTSGSTVYLIGQITYSV